MRTTTIQRHRRIRNEATRLLGTMPAMHIYAHLAEKFGYSEERIRKIIAK